MAVEDSVAQDQIRAFVERIERMEEEKAALSSDIREIYQEAKGNGFDVKILRRVVGIRKQDASERMEQEAILELYMSALGMVAAPPEYNDERERLNSMASTVNSALQRAPKSTTQNTSNPGADSAENTAAVTTPKPQLAPQAGSDLTTSNALSGQVADIASGEAQTEGAAVGESPAIPAGEDIAAQPEGGEDVAIDSAQIAAEEGAQNVSADASIYPLPGEVYWENTPRQPVHQHEYSKAFGTLGQDIHVITEDIAKAQSQAIVMMGDTILDGWARYNVARGMVGMDGQTTEYPAYQYDGTDPLLDCIRLNVAGRILNDSQRQIIAKRLIALEPKRKADIIKAFGFIAEVAA